MNTNERDERTEPEITADVGRLRFNDLLGISLPLAEPECEIVTVKAFNAGAILLSSGLSIDEAMMPGAEIEQRWLILSEKKSMWAFGEVRLTWKLSDA